MGSTDNSDRNPPEQLFDLAPMRELPPELLIDRHEDDPLDDLMLALGLVFNDLKGIVAAQMYLVERRPPTLRDEQRGQWSGYVDQANRYAASVIHELLKLIHKQGAVTSGPEFKALLVRAPALCRKSWNELCGYGGTSFAKALERIRNNGAFHFYNPKQLKKAYRRTFFDSEAEETRTACVSFGDNWERSRLYYVDAAAQMLKTQEAEAAGESHFDERLSKAVGVANYALGGLLLRYIVDKRDGADAHPPPRARRAGPSAQARQKAKGERKRRRRAKRTGKGRR